MRYVWVGLSVVLIDLLGKLLALHGVLKDGLLLPLGFFQLSLFAGSDILLVDRPLALNLGTGLILLVPLVALLFMLLLDRPLLMGYTLFGLGVQFLAGSGLAEALTRILNGESAPFVVYGATGPPVILIAARHLALLIGVGVLVTDQVVRRKARRVPPPALHIAPDIAIDLTRLRRGDDNIRIDVNLSATFVRDTRSAIAQRVNNFLADSSAADHPEPPAEKVLHALCESYAGMLRVVINRVRPTGDTSSIDLLRLAVLMFVREQIRDALAEGIEKCYERSRGTLHSEDDERELRLDAERLMASRATAFHQFCREVFLVLDGHEQSGRELPADVSALELFRVPLLQVASPEDDDVLMQYYPLLGRRRSDAYSFRRLDTLFNEVFPVSMSAGYENTAPGETSSTSLLSDPQNIALLLDTATTKDAMRNAREEKDRAALGSLRGLLRFQRLQLARLRVALERAGLVPTLLAIYETPELYSNYSGAYAPQLLIDLLRSRQSGTRIWRRMRRRGGRASDKPALLPLLRALQRIRVRSRRDISAVLLRFTEDFAVYRRDMQIYLAVQAALNKIRLLFDEREIQMVRLNRRLYEFPTPDEVAVSADAIAGHVILKADLRGSTQITEQLVRRELNPATYFSRNFYDPVTALTRQYGGEKIFIEGDAMILMFLETGDPNRERLAVAKACALAVRLLETVAASNARNLSYDLPCLEIGIGISYQSGSPTYVFDGTTRIVISPAINRADRLSSSARGLRKYISLHPHAPRVAVFRSNEPTVDVNDTSVTLQIYNVDGIALEPAAFAQLATELPLQQIVDVPESLRDGDIFATAGPALAGKSRRLVIRRAKICALNEAPLEMIDPTAAFYYEVVAAPALLEVVEQAPLGAFLTTSSKPLSIALP